MPVPSVISASAADVEAAVVLLLAQMEEHAIATAPDALREVTRAVISDPRHGFILLAIAEEGPAGIAYAAAHLSAEHGGIIRWLEELYVLPAWRGRGLGAALLGEVVARARKLEWRGLELEILRGHERAVPLYERHAFRPLARARFSRIF